MARQGDGRVARRAICIGAGVRASRGGWLAPKRRIERRRNMNTYVREIKGMLENMGLVRRSESSWVGGFFAGAGLGAVAGAAVAALLTPSNGKEMRKLVRS